MTWYKTLTLQFLALADKIFLLTGMHWRRSPHLICPIEHGQCLQSSSSDPSLQSFIAPSQTFVRAMHCFWSLHFMWNSGQAQFIQSSGSSSDKSQSWSSSHTKTFFMHFPLATHFQYPSGHGHVWQNTESSSALLGQPLHMAPLQNSVVRMHFSLLGHTE